MSFFSISRRFRRRFVFSAVSALLLFASFGDIAAADIESFSSAQRDPSVSLKEFSAASLDAIVHDAKERISDSYLTKPGDFLQLLPTVTLSKSSPVTGEKKGGKTYLSVSLSASQLFGIREKRAGRDELKRKALRQIDSIAFSTKKLIERKSLFSSRLWKLSQIRKSLSNPVEIASLDEKIDETNVRLLETDIEIEKNFAEIEFLATGCER
jgi:hypothetical protein